MALYTKPLARLIDELQKLPSIGQKTAQRLAFFILKMPLTEVRQLAEAIVQAKELIRYCSACSNLSAEDPCEMCANPQRDDEIICVVAEPRDLVALERSKEFRGRYH